MGNSHWGIPWMRMQCIARVIKLRYGGYAGVPLPAVLQKRTKCRSCYFKWSLYWSNKWQNNRHCSPGRKTHPCLVCGALTIMKRNKKSSRFRLYILLKFLQDSVGWQLEVKEPPILWIASLCPSDFKSKPLVQIIWLWLSHTFILRLANTMSWISIIPSSVVTSIGRKNVWIHSCFRTWNSVKPFSAMKLLLLSPHSNYQVYSWL